MFLLFCVVASAQKRDLLPDSISLCWGDSAMLEIKDNVEYTAFINWSTPQGIVTNTRRIKAQQQGKYYVKVTNPSTSKSYSDSCFVRISYRVKPLIRDTSICKGRALVLDAKHSGLKYLWSTGETTQRITVENAGRYWVKIKSGTCLTVDSVKVKALSGSAVSVPSDLLFCANEQNKVITAKSTGKARFLWNTGATTPSIQVTKEGTYWLRSESGQCGKQVDSVRVKIKMCDCEMIIPGSFSPNEDNRNDYFFPVSTCEYSYFYCTITDRWGYTVYSSNTIAGKWDGRFKGNLCPEDIYVYRIESTERGADKKVVRTGKVSLFR